MILKQIYMVMPISVCVCVCMCMCEFLVWLGKRKTKSQPFFGHTNTCTFIYPVIMLDSFQTDATSITKYKVSKVVLKKTRSDNQ